MTSLKSKASSTLPALMMAMAALVAPERATADTLNYLGEIAPTGVTGFCPQGWASAEGQILAINQNTALFALLGTTFGGNGTTTFALPDLRSRIPMGRGSGPGLTTRVWGEVGGQETVTLSVNQLAAHSHLVNATNSDGNFAGPANRLLGAAPPNGVGQETIYSDQPPNRVMSPSMISPTGGSQPFSVQDPTLVIRYCIALQGVFPSQS